MFFQDVAVSRQSKRACSALNLRNVFKITSFLLNYYNKDKDCYYVKSRITSSALASIGWVPSIQWMGMPCRSMRRNQVI